jgi:hypothetical protein
MDNLDKKLIETLKRWQGKKASKAAVKFADTFGQETYRQERALAFHFQEGVEPLLELLRLCCDMTDGDLSYRIRTTLEEFKLLDN